MKSFLSHRSRRWGYHGWGLLVHGADKPIPWTVCTTRDEVRKLRQSHSDLFPDRAEIVKIKISVEVVK